MPECPLWVKSGHFTANSDIHPQTPKWHRLLPPIKWLLEAIQISLPTEE
jgi:hypothetical protein